MFGPSDAWNTIVGVVGDVRQTSLAAPLQDAVYLTPEQSSLVDRTMSLALRAEGDPRPLVAAVRNALWAVDRNVAIVRIAPMDDLVARVESERRFALTLFEAFGLSALLLAAVGLNGVLSGSVVERTREIGVRSALGASRREILALVLGDGTALTAWGVAAGTIAALVASRALTALLFGISSEDPPTYAGVIALLTAVSAIACAIPALRAARIDPAVTLKAE